VLLAYAKLTLYGDLLDSRVPDDPYLGRELTRYFPSQLVERYPDALDNHRLRREIISTQLTNSMINRGGPSFAVRIGDQTGAPAAMIAAAFFVVRNSYDMISLNSAIDALDSKISGKLQLELYATIEDLLLDRIVWFVRNVDVSKGLADVVEHYRAGIEQVAGALYRVLPEEAGKAFAARATELTNAGVPEDLARKIADLRALAAAPDIVSVADRTGKPVQDVAATYFAAGAFFQLDRIANAARGIQVTDYFDRRRSRAHPSRRAWDCELGADALEAERGGEPAGGFGEAVSARSAPNAGNASSR
jgi:glutamate dehydrogenase